MSTFTLPPATRAALGALFVAYLALRSAQQMPQPAPGSADAITPVRQAYDRIIPVLPKSGQIGYLGSPDTLRHFQAQYSLAPRVIVRGDNFEYVIVDAGYEGDMGNLAGHEMVAQSGHGASVYRRKSP